MKWTGLQCSIAYQQLLITTSAVSFRMKSPNSHFANGKMIKHSWGLLGIHTVLQAAGPGPGQHNLSRRREVGRNRSAGGHLPGWLLQDGCKPACALRYPQRCKRCRRLCRPPVAADGLGHRCTQSEPLFHLLGQSEPGVKGRKEYTGVNKTYFIKAHP